MATNFERLIFEIIATDKGASRRFDEFRGKVDQTSRSLDDNTKKVDKSSKSFENLGSKASAATPLLSDLGGAGGMGALIGAGVVLSPIIATVGIGLAGFAAAAAGAVAPVLKAAQATGGLQANMSKLDPEQQKLARSVLGLKKQYDAFQMSLQPQVLGVFGKGVQLAGHLMKDVQPIAQATGKALGGLLDRVDAEFQSGTWKQFFSWMAAQAGPDIQQLGDVFINLLHNLPQLLKDLQPLARGLVNVGNVAAKAAGPLGKIGDAAVKSNEAQLHAVKSTDSLVETWTNRYIPGARAVNNSISWWQRLLSGASDATVHASETTATLAKRLADAHTATADLIHPIDTAAGGIQSAGDAAQIAKTYIHGMAMEVTNLTTAMGKSVGPNSTFNSDLINTYDAAKQSAAALKKSHDQIGLHTQAERDSFKYNQGLIDDLVTLAKDAGTSATKQRQASGAIRDALPILQRAKGGTQGYWQEVRTLVNWLHNYQAIHDLKRLITVSGKGTWKIVAGNPQGVMSGVSGARGAYVSAGTTSTADDVVARVSKGELIVPTRMVNSGAVDHLRGQIPGFASGGVAGSYSGRVRGLPGFINHETNATVTAIASATAKALAAAITGAMSGGFSGGALGGSAAVNRRIAMSMFPWPGWMWPSFNNLEMSEAGYSLTATNPSSGAYGMAQFINGPGEYYQWGGNPNTAGGQLIAMFNYIRSRYGNPAAAWQFHLANDYYDQGGYLPTGASIAVNNTGRPERVSTARGDAALIARLDRVIALLEAAPSRTGAALGGALNGATRRVALGR